MHPRANSDHSSMTTNSKKANARNPRKRRRNVDDEYDLTHFALDNIAESILLIQNEMVIYSNQSFTRNISPIAKGFPVDHLNIFKDNQIQAFLDIVHHCLLTQSEQTIILPIVTPSGAFQRTEVIVKAFDEYSALCKFIVPSSLRQHNKQEGDDRGTDEDNSRYKYFEILDKECDVYWNVAEFDEDAQDLKVLFRSYADRVRHAKEGFPWEKTAPGYWTVRDLGFSRQELKWWLSNVNNLEPQAHKTLTDWITLPDTDPVAIQGCVHYVGRSPSSGRKMYLFKYEDVTARIKLEEQLTAERKRLEQMNQVSTMLRALFDLSPLLMGNADVPPNENEVHIKVVNNSLKQFFIKGYNFQMTPEHEASGFGLKSDIGLPDATVERFRNCLMQSLNLSKPIQFDLQSSSFGGAGPMMSVCAIHMGGSNYSFVAHDVNERFLMEEQLKQNQHVLEMLVKARTQELEDALKVKSRFLATMSHEIRTPLSGIMGALTLLSDSPSLIHEERDSVRIGKLCGEQLLVLINDILDFSKIDERTMILEKVPFSLRETIEGSLDVVAFDADAKALELICDIKNIIPATIKGDQVRLRQILVNLLNNAVKFSHHGTITVKVSSENLEDGKVKLQFSVSDQGIGISKEAAPHIFQPFCQADSSITRKFGGTGLGLAISKRLSEMMGGEMWFESEENVGSTFSFTIIAETTEQSIMDQIEPISVPSSTTQGNQQVVVVIVRHNLPIASFLAEYIQLLGLQTIVLESPDEALAWLSDDSNHKFVAGIFANFLWMAASTSSSLIANNKCKMVHVGYKRPQLLDSQVYFLKKPVRIAALRTLLCQMLKCEHIEISNLTVARPIPKFATTKIMIAEDNILNQQMIIRILNSIGFTNVYIADNGKRATEIVKEQTFDVILMDVMMPEMGGLEATEKIRAEPLPSQPIIIALTADAYEATKEKCYQSGMHAVLTKPVDKRELTETLVHFLDR